MPRLKSPAVDELSQLAETVLEKKKKIGDSVGPLIDAVDLAARRLGEDFRAPAPFHRVQEGETETTWTLVVARPEEGPQHLLHAEITVHKTDADEKREEQTDMVEMVYAPSLPLHVRIRLLDKVEGSKHNVLERFALAYRRHCKQVFADLL